MMHQMVKATILVVFFGEALTASAAPTLYNVVDLGALSARRPNGGAEGICSAGIVVGMSESEVGGFHAFSWTPSSGMIDLGTLGGSYSDARAVNAAGVIAGSSELASGNVHAYRYTNGTMTDLGTLGGERSEAWSVNDAGQVVGYAERADGLPRAFVHDGQSMTELPTLGGDRGYAMSISDSGSIAGNAETSDGFTHAALWTAGGIVDLHGDFQDQSWAYDVNDFGQVVGEWDDTAYRYDNGTYVPLGTFGGNSTQPMALNNFGDVVGGSEYSNGDYGAFVYRDGQLIDLSRAIPTDSGWVLDWANDIDDAGRIVGWGTINRESRAFMLIPIPEPASAVLVLAGIAGLHRRRRLPMPR